MEETGDPGIDRSTLLAKIYQGMLADKVSNLNQSRNIVVSREHYQTLLSKIVVQKSQDALNNAFMKDKDKRINYLEQRIQEQREEIERFKKRY